MVDRKQGKIAIFIKLQRLAIKSIKSFSLYFHMVLSVREIKKRVGMKADSRLAHSAEVVLIKEKYDICILR